MFTAITNFAGNHGFNPEAIKDAIYNKDGSVKKQMKYGTEGENAAYLSPTNFNRVLTGAKALDFITGAALVTLSVLTLLGFVPSMGAVPTLAMGIIGGASVAGPFFEGVEKAIDVAIASCKGGVAYCGNKCSTDVEIRPIING